MRKRSNQAGKERLTLGVVRVLNNHFGNRLSYLQRTWGLVTRRTPYQRSEPQCPPQIPHALVSQAQVELVDIPLMPLTQACLNLPGPSNL